MFSLEDFISDYPDQDDPNIQMKLTAKRELNELAPNLNERLAGRGEFYKHQKLYHRIFKNYRKSLILDRTGTGKTCEVVSIAEYFKNIESTGKSPLDEFPHIKKILFLVKGPNIKTELRNQLVYKCTPEGTYDTFNVVSAKTNKDKEGLITREIKEWYEIESFEAFANGLFKKGDTTIKKEYSGTMIFIDEGQELNSNNKGNDIPEQLANEIKYFESEKAKLKDGEKFDKKPNVYNQIWRLTHLVERSYIYIATATPMINSPEELLYRLNILNPIDRQIRHGQFDWNKIKKAELEPYVRGLISYVRELDNGIEIKEHGQTSKVYFGDLKSGVVIYNTVMSEFQAESYNRARQTTNHTKTGGETGDSFYLKELSASNFVFPDGSAGGVFEHTISKTEGKTTRVKNEEGISKYVDQKKLDEYEPSAEFARYLSNIDNIQRSSSKYADIVRRYSRLHNGNKNIGKAFLYGKMKSGSGLYALGLCLGAHGFERFKNNFSAFIFDPVKGYRVIKSDLEAIPRYAIITGDTPPSRRNAIMELYNSYENRHGDYIQILLGSEVTQAGINLSDVLNFEFVSSGWHLSGLYQALSRILRATSHENLLREMKTVTINIYRHAASTEEQYNNFMEKEYNFDDILGPGELSTDVFTYIISEDKDIRIKRVEHILVDLSVNYIINYDRNRRSTDKDYTQICFYDKCDPKPETKYDIKLLDSENYWDNLDKTDTSTYDLYYTDEITKYFLDVFKKLFQINNVYKFDDLFQLKEFRKIPKRYGVISINKIIDNNIIFYNFLGMPSYLRMIQNVLFLTTEYDKTIYTDIYYNNNIILRNNYDLSDYLKNSDVFTSSKINNILDSTDYKNLDSEISKLNIDEKTKLLEDCIASIAQEDDNATEVQKLIYDKYRYVIFKFRKPVSAIAVVGSQYRKFIAAEKKILVRFLINCC